MTIPLIVRYVSRSRLWWIVAAVIAGAPLLRILLMLRIPTAYSGIAVYVLMPCRADALGWGILAALITPPYGSGSFSCERTSAFCSERSHLSPQHCC
jgi:hypothetical protein